ncbi:MAG: hypothetical protein Q8P12_01795, partial [bacterium]|nr:hypothetical protein [bacterium]
VGWVFPNLVDFDLKKTDSKLFTDGQSYAMQETIIGLPAAEVNASGDEDEPPISELKQGATGVFYMKKEGKTPLCTIPFTVNSSIFDQGTHLRFEASDFYGRPFVIEVAPGVTTIKKIGHQYNTYVVPHDAQFINTGRNLVRLQDSAGTARELKNADKLKAATAKKGVIEVSSDDQNVYNLSGTNLGELQGDTRGVGANKARWHLVALGLTPGEADRTLRRAKEEGRAKVVDSKPLVTQREKQGQVLRDTVLPLLVGLPRLNLDLTKEASVIDDEAVVDKVLSLGLLTPENLQIFVDALPSLEDTVSRLAEILITVRLGMKKIPESAVKRAMDGLDTVISGLRSMETLKYVGQPPAGTL